MFKNNESSIGGVKIYVDNLKYYIAESYVLLRSHLNHIQRYNDKIGSFQNSGRKDYFKLLKMAFDQNIRNMESVILPLKESVSIEGYESVMLSPKHDAPNLTLKDFLYLRRDWSFSNESEDQLSKVYTFIQQELNKIDHTQNSALFLGCGVGRIAIDFVESYEKVFATDKSYSMIWHLQKLLNGDSITFYNPKISNVQKVENVAKEYTVKIPAKTLKKINEGRFECFVSDILETSIKPAQINVVFSVFFSDVIALKLWFNLIDDVLTSNGLFVHFGPLDYFFTDEREMLTAEEFRSFFETKGYNTLVDTTIDLPHLRDSNSNSYKVYRNWLFVAQKGAANYNRFNLKGSSILKLVEPLKYERKGLINDGIKEQEVNLQLPHGNFEGADSVIIVLSLIDGEISFDDILKKLEFMRYEIDKEDLQELITSFLNDKILKIIN